MEWSYGCPVGRRVQNWAWRWHAGLKVEARTLRVEGGLERQVHKAEGASVQLPTKGVYLQHGPCGGGSRAAGSCQCASNAGPAGDLCAEDLLRAPLPRLGAVIQKMGLC